MQKAWVLLGLKKVFDYDGLIPRLVDCFAVLKSVEFRDVCVGRVSQRAVYDLQAVMIFVSVLKDSQTSKDLCRPWCEKSAQSGDGYYSGRVLSSQFRLVRMCSYAVQSSEIGICRVSLYA